MICDTCIHKEVCYEKEEDRRALRHCSDYFNFEDELDKIRTEIEQTYINITYQENKDRQASWGLRKTLEIIDKYRAESENKE